MYGTVCINISQLRLTKLTKSFNFLKFQPVIYIGYTILTT